MNRSDAMAAEHEKKDVEAGTQHQGIGHWQMLLNQGVLTPEIENWEYEGSGTEEDPYVVEWIDNDPRNPMRWPQAKKVCDFDSET